MSIYHWSLRMRGHSKLESERLCALNIKRMERLVEGRSRAISHNQALRGRLPASINEFTEAWGQGMFARL